MKSAHGSTLEAGRSKEDMSFTIWNMRDNELFNDIPDFFQEGLLMERDSHGNFQFSQVETDKVVLGMVRDYLNILKILIGCDFQSCKA